MASISSRPQWVNSIFVSGSFFTHLSWYIATSWLQQTVYYHVSCLYTMNSVQLPRLAAGACLYKCLASEKRNHHTELPCPHARQPIRAALYVYLYRFQVIHTKDCPRQPPKYNWALLHHNIEWKYSVGLVFGPNGLLWPRAMTLRFHRTIDTLASQHDGFGLCQL